MTGELQVMDPTGHTSVKWDASNPDDVAAAKIIFEEMRAKGYSAFTTGQRGKRLTEFDASAEKVVLIPQLVGG